MIRRAGFNNGPVCNLPRGASVRLCEGLRTPAHGMRGAVITGRHLKTFTEADIVRGDFPLSARPASEPSRTAGLS